MNQKIEFFLKYVTSIILCLMCYGYATSELKRRKRWDILGTLMLGSALLVVVVALFPFALSLLKNRRWN